MPGTKSKRILKGIAIWLPTILFGALFIMQGLMKVMPGSPWRAMFDGWGYPAGSHIVVGVVELLAGLALFLPRTAGYAAATLCMVMLGAAATHLVHGESTQTAFTTGFATLFAALAYVRLPRLRNPSVQTALE